MQGLYFSIRKIMVFCMNRETDIIRTMKKLLDLTNDLKRVYKNVNRITDDGCPST